MAKNTALNVKVGDKVIIKDNTLRIGTDEVEHLLGLVLTIGNIYIDENSSLVRLGLVSPIRMNRLHNLDGDTVQGYGWYVTFAIKDFDLFFIKVNHHCIIDKDFIYKSKNLKGIKGKKIIAVDEHTCVIETETYVNGHSCDGNGKAGYCITVPCSIIKDIIS